MRMVLTLENFPVNRCIFFHNWWNHNRKTQGWTWVEPSQNPSFPTQFLSASWAFSYTSWAQPENLKTQCDANPREGFGLWIERIEVLKYKIKCQSMRLSLNRTSTKENQSMKDKVLLIFSSKSPYCITFKYIGVGGSKLKVNHPDLKL